MKRTTIMLPARLKASAQRRARKSGMSLASLIRLSLERELANGGGKVDSGDPFLSDNMTFRNGGPPDVARNHDRYLYGEQSDFR